VVNLTTTSAIDDIAARHKRRVWRTPVGEANVVQRMLDVGAVIGGEGSNGGIIFPAVQYCRDSYTGMAFVLDRMAATGKSLSQLAAALPRYVRRSGKLTFEHGRLGPLMQELTKRFPDAAADRTDGLKLNWDGGKWLHVRASNTEPVLRITVESKEAGDADALYERVMAMAG